MKAEYDLSKMKSRKNPYAAQLKQQSLAKKTITVTLDADIAEIFTDSEAVNKALRAILSAFPASATQHLNV